MLDFLMISTRRTRSSVEIYPKFIIKNSKDLMIRAGDFYAIWLEDFGLWSTNEEDVVRTIDNLLDEYHRENIKKFDGESVYIKYMWDSETGMIDAWHKYCQKQLRDNYQPLDKKLIFADQVTKKEDYASIKLSYSLNPSGQCLAYDELVSTLYSEEERKKIEWCIGAVFSGDSKKIQKFAAFYGPPGTGKSTILDIIAKLFEDYVATFDAESLGSNSNNFALAPFKSNPLVAINHDSDLSKIEKNVTLNSLTSHEKMVVNEKNKGQYTMRFNSFLFMGTNKPVKITDAKSGLLRRLIDIHPTGNKIPFTRYVQLVKKVDFELGAIASKCLDIYLNNKLAYENYRPTLMLSESNDFYNFVSDSYQIFKKDDSTTLKAAWVMYKRYTEEARVTYPMPMRIFSSELKNYFKEYMERVKVGDEWIRSYYIGFKTDIFDTQTPLTEEIIKNTGSTIVFNEQKSKLDIFCSECKAQYASRSETPKQKWDEVATTLSNLDTHRVHYVKLPLEHIVIDFDIKDENGKKSFEKNLEAASKWPKTYAELSKSGGGIHLHYIYTGDPMLLSRVYDSDIEVKIFNGNGSLRRKLTKCNSENIATISSGLPLKDNGGAKMINFEAVKNEKALRTLVKKNLNKEYHSGTKPSIDFIFKILNDAYDSGIHYDISDMHGAVLAFAASSTNQSEYCINLVTKMKFKSEEPSDWADDAEKPIVFLDIEIFPNVSFLNWKFQGKNKSVQRLINPTIKEIESLLKYRIITFNGRRYDNHIMYAMLLGYSNAELYILSQLIIGEKRGFFSEAYNLSYTDVYDYAKTKQSLKKWQVQLGITHKELGLPWDKPVPKELWPKVAEYCDNDVISLEAVFDATQGDFQARLILADLADMTPNDTTNQLTTKIIFGSDKNPELNYVDLSKEFPGYEFKKTWNDETKKFDVANMYRGVDLKFGGYVFSEPGMYYDVGLLDISSMHPNSIIKLGLLGKYTPNFKAIVDARIALKHGDEEIVRNSFNGKLVKYLGDPDKLNWGAIAEALKIAINAVYGLTSAKFKNAFKHPLNENNIVALRGALFMKTLQDELVLRGYQVIHIKTDSIKIPNITQDAIDFCMKFAQRYGYTFEHEAVYAKMCLVNDAVYIARYNKDGIINKKGKKANEWTATGTQFAVPYVFKRCFSKESIVFEDLCEVKEVTNSAIYLNLNETTPDEDKLNFIGRVGLFCPVKPGNGGGLLVRSAMKKGVPCFDSVTGTKGYRWLEAEDVKNIIKKRKMSIEDVMAKLIDMSYYTRLVNNAIEDINKYGDYEFFTGDEGPDDLPFDL